MTHRTSRGLAATAIGAALFAITGCGGGDSPSQTQAVKKGGSLTFALNADPGNLDPQRSVNGANQVLVHFAYDTPVTLLDDGKIAPRVVSEWKNDGKTWLLTVRKGITCADGTPMDAKTVADNISYVGDPENGSPMTGVKVPSGAKATADAEAGTVTVELTGEAPFFLENLSELPLVCAKGMANRDSLAKASNGSGPYTIAAVEPGVSYTYAVRKGYAWGLDGAKTDAEGLPAKVTFRIVENQTTAANLLLSGQINVAQVSGAETKRLEAQKLFSSGFNSINSEVAFNQSAGEAGADPEVRKALIAALDLNALAKIDTGGLGKPADGLVASPKICGGNTMTGNVPAYDLDAAKSALAGKKLSITLLYANNEPTKAATAQYIAAQWKQLGVDVKLSEQSFDQVSAVVFGTGKWGATLIGLGVNNPAVLIPFFSGDAPKKGVNFGHVENADYSSLVEKASSQPGASGCADWNAAESALMRDSDITPISTEPVLFWGKNAEFDVQMNVLIPTSLRVLAR